MNPPTHRDHGPAQAAAPVAAARVIPYAGPQTNPDDQNPRYRLADVPRLVLGVIIVVAIDIVGAGVVIIGVVMTLAGLRHPELHVCIAVAACGMVVTTLGLVPLIVTVVVLVKNVRALTLPRQADGPFPTHDHPRP